MREPSSLTSTGKLIRFSGCPPLRNVSLTRLVQFWFHHAAAGVAQARCSASVNPKAAAPRRRRTSGAVLLTSLGHCKTNTGTVKGSAPYAYPLEEFRAGVSPPG